MHEFDAIIASRGAHNAIVEYARVKVLLVVSQTWMHIAFLITFGE